MYSESSDILYVLKPNHFELGLLGFEQKEIVLYNFKLFFQNYNQQYPMAYLYQIILKMI